MAGRERRPDAAIGHMKAVPVPEIIVAVPEMKIGVADAASPHPYQDLSPGRDRRGRFVRLERGPVRDDLVCLHRQAWPRTTGVFSAGMLW